MSTVGKGTKEQRGKSKGRRVNFLSSSLHASNKPILARSYTADPFTCVCGYLLLFIFTPFERSVGERVSKGFPVPLLETKDGWVGP